MTDKDAVSISKGLSDKPDYRDEPRKKRTRTHRQRSSTSERPKAPVASERASECAQRWMDLASEHGYRLPFNTNFLARKISDRVSGDKQLMQFEGTDREDDSRRWVLKMVELFWSEYVKPEDTNANVSDVFLDLCWDDLRDYAFTCLRAAYLKKYGIRRQRPDEESEAAEERRNAQARFDEERKNLKMEAWLEKCKDQIGKPPPTFRKLDDKHREVLKSMRERRDARRARKTDG